MLTPAQRKWFLLEQILVPVLFNVGFNAALGWFTFRNELPVPLWRAPSLTHPSVGGDILGMLFFLPFFTCVIATPLIKRAVRIGKLERVSITPEEHWLLRSMPRGVFARAGFIGLGCALLLGPLSIGGLALLGMSDWSLEAAVWFKGVYAGLLAALVQPPIALYAICPDEADVVTQPGT
jgi:hypothetical protein